MVSIITINYNGYKDTCELIDSLYQHETYPFEVIVVDNASQNDEGFLLRGLYPQCNVICSDTNLGFAGGNNLGTKEANGEHILYINNDIIINEPFLEPLVKKMESDSAIGAVSPKIKYTHHPDIIQYAGYTAMTPITLKNDLIGVNETDGEQFDQATETAFIHGACMLTSRDILEEAGTMTEVYFLFYEELDWTLQIKRKGYTVWYEPCSVVYHKESMTIKRGSALRHYYLTRSRLLFARRNYNGWEKWGSCLYQFFLVMPRNLLRYYLKGEPEMVKASWNGALRGAIDKSRG